VMKLPTRGAETVGAAPTSLVLTKLRTGAFALAFSSNLSAFEREAGFPPQRAGGGGSAERNPNSANGRRKLNANLGTVQLQNHTFLVL